MLNFFDCTCMLGKIPGKSLAFHKIDGLVKELEHHNITRALVFHSVYGGAQENERLLDALEGKPNLYPVAVVSPWESSTEKLTARTLEILRKKAYGVRFFPADESFEFSPAYLKEVMAIVVKRRLPVMIDADQLGGLGSLATMMKAYPKTDFILSKFTVYSPRPILELLDKFPNFHIDTSLFRNWQGIEDFIARFGADRIIFGTYMPVLDPGAAVTRLLYASASRKHIEQIAFGNLDQIIAKIRK